MIRCHINLMQSLYGSKKKLTDIGTWTLMPDGAVGISRLVAMTLPLAADIYRFYQEPVSSGFSLVKYGYATNESYCIPGGLLAKLDVPPSVRTYSFFNPSF
jgi:hypothetical protein